MQRAFADLASKESVSPFPPSINAHSSRLHGRGRARFGLRWPRMLQRGHLGLRGANIQPQPAPGMFAGGETKTFAGLGAAIAYPQLILLCLQASCFPPGFSRPTICLPLVPAGLSIFISLCSLWWSPVTCWSCGPAWRLRLCWLQGMAVQWGPSSKQSHHSSFSSSGHLRNTPWPASPLCPCGRAARRRRAPRLPTYQAGMTLSIGS